MEGPAQWKKADKSGTGRSHDDRQRIVADQRLRQRNPVSTVAKHQHRFSVKLTTELTARAAACGLGVMQRGQQQRKRP